MEVSVTVPQASLLRRSSKMVTCFDGCSTIPNVVDNGHQWYRTTSGSDIGKTNHDSNNNATDDATLDDHHPFSVYDPVKYLSAITEETFFGPSPHRLPSVMANDNNTNTTKWSDHHAPIRRDSPPHPYAHNDDQICSWSECNNRNNDTANTTPNNNNNNNNNTNNDSGDNSCDHNKTINTILNYQNEILDARRVESDNSGGIFTNSNAASWHVTSSSPHNFLSSPFSSTSSHSAPMSSSASPPRSSYCMHTLSPSAKTTSILEPSASPPEDCPSPLTDPSLFEHIMQRSGLAVSPRSNCAHAAFLGPSPSQSCYHLSGEKDDWDQDCLEEKNNGMVMWKSKHPYHWTSADVLDWVFSISLEHGLDMKELRAEHFQNVIGSELCEMKLKDFVQLEPNFGAFMFEMLEKLTCKAQYIPPDANYQHPGVLVGSVDKSLPPDFTHVLLPDAAPIFTALKQDERDHSFYHHGYNQHCHQTPFPPPDDRPSGCSPNASFTTQVLRRRSGRPRVRNIQYDVREGKEQKAKNQHLWEFIYETLMSPSHNPQFLRWENQREGIFRFVQSEAVAQLWGRRKNNENMTYEKLSRAMRHYYRRGILERVEGRRLVYKFSMKAMERIKNKKATST